ncbi:MAG: right-handed parallel beta-helix repeat-containing protein [Clostridiales bacterium]|nr:MAG: right-handed parallel beta-helix repeat-containing protein [Clostridiales bacterium]
MGDDCSNLHQRISQGISFVEGDRYSIIAKKADWSTPIRGGDTIEILNNDFSVTGFAATVKSAEYVDGIGIKLTFDKEIPQNLPESCIVSNKTIGQNTWGIIRNNRFHDNLGRGLLVRGDHILIENNTFEHTNSSATMTEVEITSGWVSGLPSSHLWFKGNKFINCNVSEKQEATMNFTHNLQGGYSAGTSLISRLLIEDNDFVNTTARGIVIDLFDDVTIRNNRFTGFKERPNSIKERGGLKITNGKHLKIYGNRFEKVRILQAM